MRIAVWPDGMYCPVDELLDMEWTSDDYVIIDTEQEEASRELLASHNIELDLEELNV